LIRYRHIYYYDDTRYRESQFIIFEYLMGSEFLMDFYVYSKIIGTALPPTDLTISGVEDFIEYVKGKTLSITFHGSTTPKYTVHFDDSCKYYKCTSADGDVAIIVKKPFLFISGYYWGHIYLWVYVTPKLIDDINNHDSAISSYDPDTDHSLGINRIVERYFNTNDMSGIQHSDLSINDYDNDNLFGYNLIRALLGPSNYIESCNINVGDILFYGYIYSSSYETLDEVPIYTYFPLLRPKLDTDGYFNPYPQYSPHYEDSVITYLELYMGLLSSDSIYYFYLESTYSLSHFSIPTWCHISDIGHLPSWDVHGCNLMVPFRFVGTTNCLDPVTDDWNTEHTINNANYLFMISKSPSSSTYSIKGVGCNEITQPLDFNASSTVYTYISFYPFESLYTFTFSGSGYAFDTIRDILLNEVRLENFETCFVMFSDKLIDDEDDFINIYNIIRAALPNSIICYRGDDSRIRHELKNKVVHSDAIITDLDTNKKMPLVIKYIRYAERLYKLFNE
jgi:hypothetical protein